MPYIKPMNDASGIGIKKPSNEYLIGKFQKPALFSNLLRKTLGFVYVAILACLLLFAFWTKLFGKIFRIFIMKLSHKNKSMSIMFMLI